MQINTVKTYAIYLLSTNLHFILSLFYLLLHAFITKINLFKYRTSNHNINITNSCINNLVHTNYVYEIMKLNNIHGHD